MPPSAFPNEVEHSDRTGKPTILVFLHPHCPCSQATLDQLKNFLPTKKQEVEFRLIVVVPPEAESGWENGPLMRNINRFPGQSFEIDRGGKEANRFAAATSGQVMYYRVDRTLAFSGGITPSRGHTGESQGLQAILNLLGHENTPYMQTPVFGCPLFNKSSFCEGKSLCKS